MSYLFQKSLPSQFLTMAVGNFISRMNECHARGGCFYTKGPPWKQEKLAGLPGVYAMRLSTKGRYAVMAMADLASHEAFVCFVSFVVFVVCLVFLLSFLVLL